MGLAIPELVGRPAFLHDYLHEHGWDTFIHTFGMKLVPDNLDPRIPLVERFERSTAEVGLAALFNQYLLDQVVSNTKARSRLVVVRPRGVMYRDLNRQIDEAGIEAVTVLGANRESLAQAFINALAKDPAK